MHLSLYALTLFLSSFIAHAEIDPYLIYTKKNGPGFTYSVLKSGKLTEQKSYGYADIEEKKRITADSRFIIGSLSKQVTAMAVLLLMKDEKVKEDQFITHYLSDLPSYMSKIKVRHLLHHQSGLADYGVMCDDSKSPIGNAEILKFLASKNKTEFEPGSQFEYSNSGYVILAELVAKVSGMPFSEFLKKNIFEKLKMTHTELVTLKNEPALIQQMHSYTSWPHFKRNDLNACNYKQGPGGVISSMNDYIKWLKAVSENTLITEAWTQRMWKPAQLDNGDKTQYADGWFISSLKDHSLIWHNGGWLSFLTYAGYLPDQKTWVAVFSNYEGLDINQIGKDLLKKHLK